MTASHRAPETLTSAPWVRLARILRPESSHLFLKLDHLSPTGSSYDRRCWALLEQAEGDGRLSPGMRVVEGSDGATAVSLAWACATRGYTFTAAIPENGTLETRELLRAYGAELLLTPFASGLRGAIDRAADRLAALGPGRGWSPRLHDRTDTVSIQRGLLGRELELAIEAQGGQAGDVTFVCGVGTGATLAAAAELKCSRPMRLVAVEPVESPTLAGGAPRPHRLLGLGPGFVPAAINSQVRTAIDRIVPVSAETAWEMKGRLARAEGLLVGISTGALVAAAVAEAAEQGPERTIFTLACDTGERYFSLSEQLTPNQEVR